VVPPSDAIDRLAQPARLALLCPNHLAHARVCDPRRHTRLVESNWNRNHRHSAVQRLHDGIQTGMRNNQLGTL
jgi:hypothetical protein